MKLEPIKNQFEILNYVNVVVRISDNAVVDQLSKRGDVVSIQPWVEPKKMDERQNQIMAGNLTGNAPTPGNYLLYLASHGFTFNTPSSFGVNLSDSGVDNATTTPNHFALYTLGDPTSPANSRIVYNRLEGTPNAGSTLQGCDGHGNLNSHVIGGYVPTGGIFGAFPHADAAGFRYDLGIAPFVKIGSSVIFDPDTFTNPNLPNLESKAYNDGMRISSNSWGANVGGAYTASSQAYDALVRDAQPAGSTFATAGNQEMVIVFAAGNAGSGANTVGAPGTAKNVITVGAAENVQAFGGSDFCGVGDSGADSANDIIGFSSRGPMDDGRVKPDIMGPGTHVSGGVAQQTLVSPTGSGLGDDLACFSGEGVCGGAGSNFFPAGQQWYTASSGTSHSTPAVSGFAALIRQFYINNGQTPPTPAMTKALMINTARYMTGVGANDTLPSNNQGMGETNFNSFFDVFVTANILHDQLAADTFSATGEQRIITGNVSDNGKPFRVSLAWTDAPGSTTGNAFVNNLDLEVVVGGNSYKGNVFTGASSTPGGVADPRNNSESVFIPAGVSGPFAVRVRATNIAGDGLPGNADLTDQDYALVIYNANEVAQPLIEAGATAITAESCTPANGAIDPGETVTVDFSLNNTGTAPTTNLVATLQATGGVNSPSGPQNYGAIPVGGSASRPFTFTASGSCGGTLTATFQLQDGGTNLGTVTFTFTLGVLNVSFSENFDGVVAPALPAGWTSAFTNGDGDCTAGGPLCALGSNWATVNTSSDTAPNSAFHNDPTCVTNNTLDTPSFSIGTTSAQVTFRHSFNLEDTFDGTVLEVSSPNINGGAFTDITNAAVGGSFVTGGYTDTINNTFFSPIGGRQAWSGSSGGYITTTANLGPNVMGQTIKLRFRFASDCSLGAPGHNIDSIRVNDGFVCCSNIPVISAAGGTLVNETCAPPNNAIDPGEQVTVSLRLMNALGAGSSSNLVATLQPSADVLMPSGPQNYGAIPPGGTAARDFSFTAGGSCGGMITLTLQLQDGPTNLGTVNYTFTLGGLTMTSVTAVYSSGNIAAPIPDLGTVEIPVEVPDLGVVSDVNVRVRLNHTFDADVDMFLVAPDGTTVELSTDNGGSGDNYGAGPNDCSGTFTVFDDSAATAITAGVAPFVGSFRPEQLLSTVNGKPSNGTWKLRVTDDEALLAGTVGCVQLEISRRRFLCCGAAGTPEIAPAGSTLVNESCPPDSNAIDPGERVTVNLAVVNNGTGSTSNLVGTLQPSANVISPSGPQSYGVVAADGGMAARDFSFTAAGACGDTITLMLQLQDGMTNLGTVTYSFTLGGTTSSTAMFSNTAPITIPASGVAAPYPSNILVSGLTGTVSKVTVTISNYNHTFPDDVDVLLVGPAGQKFIIMSDAGGGTDITARTLTFDDSAAALLPDGTLISSGTFRPTNYGATDAFAPPAPAAPYQSPATAGAATFASVFNGSNPNGTWSLYVVDQFSPDAGNFNGGWSLNITTSSPVCTTPCGGVRLVVTSTLTRTSMSTVRANFTVSNTGTLPANNTQLTTAKLGTTNTSSTLPHSLGDIPPGGSASGAVDFNNMSPGAASTLSLGGTYTSGTFSSVKRVTIP